MTGQAKMGLGTRESGLGKSAMRPHALAFRLPLAGRGGVFATAASMSFPESRVPSPESR